MIKSEEIMELARALNKAQTEMGSVKKGANNPFFKSKYADLSSVIEALKEPLNKNGITVLQNQKILESGAAAVETILLHTSGQYIGSETPVICAKQNDPQALGSAISYARRYGLQSMLSLPAEDDDGEKAMSRPTKKTSRSVDF